MENTITYDGHEFTDREGNCFAELQCESDTEWGAYIYPDGEGVYGEVIEVHPGRWNSEDAAVRDILEMLQDDDYSPVVADAVERDDDTPSINDADFLACTDCMLSLETDADTLDADAERLVAARLAELGGVAPTLAYDHFSRIPCALCGTNLHGERHGYAIIRPAADWADDAAAQLKTPSALLARVADGPYVELQLRDDANPPRLRATIATPPDDGGGYTTFPRYGATVALSDADVSDIVSLAECIRHVASLAREALDAS